MTDTMGDYKEIPVEQWRQITGLLDRIRYAMDYELEYELVRELLALFDPDSGELLSESEVEGELTRECLWGFDRDIGMWVTECGWLTSPGVDVSGSKCLGCGGKVRINEIETP